MRVAADVVLSDDERVELERRVRRRAVESRVRERARLVLLAADGVGNAGIAQRIGMNPSNVSTWRHRFLRERVPGLEDKPRSGRPVELDPALEKRIVELTLTPPKNRTHWSIRSMARAANTDKGTVARVWKKHDLKPHIVRTFKLSNDPDFEEKVEDIVGLYLSPPENAIVLSVDEKSQIQALDRSRPILPIRPGLPEHQTHDYARHGTTTLFAALNVETGHVITRLEERHRAVEFLGFLKAIHRNTPKGKDVHIILDNYQTHKTQAVRDWLEKHPRFVLHFTPTGSSWINMVERIFGKITAERIRRGAFKSVPALNRAIKEWFAEHNAHPKPFVWTAEADEIIRKVRKYRETYRTLH